MTDRIIIQGLQIETIIGVYDFEREKQQRLVVDLLMDADFTAASESDELSDTINYATIAEQIANLAQELKPQLLEYLAEHICQHLFQYFPIKRIELTLKKPDILDNAEAVGVQVIRDKKH